MNIFVSEFVCGGGWPDVEILPSLRREGLAMLQALASDFARLPAVQVFTTWDRRAGPPPLFPAQVQLHFVTGEKEERSHVTALCSARQIHAAIVIAPESNGILEQRCAWWHSQQIPLFNAEPAAHAIAGDKWQTFQLCRQAGIPTIDTMLVSDSNSFELPWVQTIAKLRDGAGSQEMQLLSTRQAWSDFLLHADVGRFIIQPFEPGCFLSVGAIVHHGILRCLLPVGEQCFDPHHLFVYTGGRIPVPSVSGKQVATIVNQILEALPGLHGYIGFDLLVPDANPDAILLVEINPRLTTAYVGYRQLTDSNLASWIVNAEQDGVPDFHGSVEFQADGQWKLTR